MSSQAFASRLTPADVFAARRELARRSVLDFTTMVDIPTVPLSQDLEEDRFDTLRVDRLASHHRLLLEALQDLADGAIPNLMVFMPPGSAKSTYVDVVFVPWVLARAPRQNAILASYGSDLARKQGRRARQLVRSTGFSNLFGVGLSAESSAADEWSLTNGSEYMAGGLLSGITGNRADFGFIDDPIKGREDADSETIRKKTREAYEDDFCTRLKPGGRQVIIQTRWHEDDLAGGILPKDWSGESGLIDCRDGRQWMVLCLPAEADRDDDPLGRKPGEMLWPEWFTERHWMPFRKSRRTWSALYQQKPTPDTGDYFQRTWFELYQSGEEPKRMRKYGSSDYAVTEKGGDWTEHGVWGIDRLGDLWLTDGWAGKTGPDEWIERQLDLVKKHKPSAWFGESGVIRRSTEPFLRRSMRKRKAHCRMEWLPSIADKPARARGFQAMCSQGMVHLPDNEFGHHVLSQLLRFPAGAEDDAVDMCSLIGRAVDDMHPAILAGEDPDVKKDFWDRAFERRDDEAATSSGADGWKVK